ncbi:MAG: hypothetical protein HQL76_02760 [Magnetococcales bacterium]|nr:hypothetical protein [Magnetococcales bacterium]
MTTLEMINSHVARLPETLQIELLHYALFLEQRIAKPGQTIKHPEEQQRFLAESLEAASRLNPFQEISNPMDWQRAIRQDRPLLGREDHSC